MFQIKVAIIFLLFEVIVCEVSTGADNVIINTLKSATLRPRSVVSLKQKSFFSTDYRHFCGGSILSKDWILTAGHCFTGKDLQSLDGFVADVGSEYRKNGTRYNLSEYHIHPNQSESIEIYRNDLALIKVRTPIDFTPTVQPVRLGTIEDQKELPVVASGWGRMSLYGPLHSKLRNLKMKTMKFEDCKKIHSRRNNTVDTATQICGFAGVGKTLCFGDSGGPLFDLKSGNQVGVFSSLEDCSGEFPVLFMRIDVFIDWINDITKLNIRLD